MRLYHSYYRQKNPGRKPKPLTGEKAKLYRKLTKAFASPVKNPEDLSRQSGPGKEWRDVGEYLRQADAERRRGRIRRGMAAADLLSDKEHKSLIQSLNILVSLDTLIAEGDADDLRPLRDMVRARIDGYLDPDSAKYGFAETIRSLRKREVEILGKRIEEIKKLDLPPMVMYARIKRARKQSERESELDPKARRIRRRIAMLDNRMREFSLAMRKHAQPTGDYFQLGGRYATMKEQDAAANKLLGQIKLNANYRPVDEELFKKAMRKVRDEAKPVWKAVSSTLADARFREAIPFADDAVFYLESNIPSQEKIDTEDIAAFLSKRTPEDVRYRILCKRNVGPPLWRKYKKGDLHTRGGLLKRLTTRVANRTILEYEKMGGRSKDSDHSLYALAPGQHVPTRARGRADKKRQLGKPFEVRDTGYWGVVLQDRKGKFPWSLIRKATGPGDRGTIYFKGVANTQIGASRALGEVAIIMQRLVALGSMAGWDNLEKSERKWLDDHRPKLSIVVADLLTKVQPKMGAGLATWIASASDMHISRAAAPTRGPIRRTGEKERERMAKNKCEALKTGQSTTIRGSRGQYTIHIEKGRGKKYKVHAVSRDGNASGVSTYDDCGDAITKGHAIGGTLVGAGRVVKAIGNPAALKRLENGARKYFRKRNPVGMPRQAAKAAHIQDVTGLMQIPGDPEEAYRYGFYAGIIQGIDTCGVQNWAKRRRIRKKYEQAILDAATGMTSSLTQPPARESRSPRVGPVIRRPDVEEYEGESEEERVMREFEDMSVE